MIPNTTLPALAGFIVAATNPNTRNMQRDALNEQSHIAQEEESDHYGVHIPAEGMRTPSQREARSKRPGAGRPERSRVSLFDADLQKASILQAPTPTVTMEQPPDMRLIPRRRTQSIPARRTRPQRMVQSIARALSSLSLSGLARRITGSASSSEESCEDGLSFGERQYIREDGTRHTRAQPRPTHGLLRGAMRPHTRYTAICPGCGRSCALGIELAEIQNCVEIEEARLSYFTERARGLRRRNDTGLARGDEALDDHRYVLGFGADDSSQSFRQRAERAKRWAAIVRYWLREETECIRAIERICVRGNGYMSDETLD